MFTINEYGFIQNWMIAGPVITPFITERSTDDQLQFEKNMRAVLADKEIAESEKLQGAVSEQEWTYYQGHGNWFVDFSEFYHLPQKVELLAKTAVYAETEMETELVLWTYTAATVYLDGACVLHNQTPVYKPIKKMSKNIRLKKGENHLLVRMQNLGVRDTRNIFGVALGVNACQVEVRLPVPEKAAQVQKYLDALMYREGKIEFMNPVPAELLVEPGNKKIEDGWQGYFENPGTAVLKVKAEIDGICLERKFECCERVKPVSVTEPNPLNNTLFDGKRTDGIGRDGVRLGGVGAVELSGAEKMHLRRIIEAVADIDYRTHEEAKRFSIYPIMAKYALKQWGNDASITYEDRRELFAQLDKMEARIDCADFVANAVIRMLHCYEPDDELRARCREVLLGFRYWMDEEGADGMCFWSENHSLLFYECLYLASSLYPDDVFTRSGRIGREQREIARQKIMEWLADVEDNGFEEFLSGGYTVVTIAALLNLVDFAEDEISRRAADIIDEQLCLLAKHTYRGSMIGPQGRIYREVVYPFKQGTQSLVHYMDPAAPWEDNIWMACFAHTSYQKPEGLKELMRTEMETDYTTGNARIVLHKEASFLLTSVQSPREDPFVPWYNNSFDPDVDRSRHHYTKSINERFHGTTNFQPGVYGYQQHLWYAALDGECVVFANHPGESADRSSMRPAYWYGNGIIPAISQKANILGAIYQIPEDYPIPFVHLYWPKCRFEETLQAGTWLFGRKGSGYIAVWCSGEMEAYDGLLSECEYRTYGNHMAYVCVCSDAGKSGSFEAFQDSCRDMNILYEEQGILDVAGKLYLKYEKQENKTQYI